MFKPYPNNVVTISFPERCEGGFEADPYTGYCEVFECQTCCTHSEWHYDTCQDCGKERDPGLMIDAAEFLLGGDR